jgi:HEAT repeat protein
MVVASGMNRLSVFQVVRYVLENGSPAGRRAAAEALAQFNGAEANALAQKMLDDPDPQVKAKIVRQIRQRGIARALPLLFQLIESPDEEVRSAARSCLPEFRFDRYLASFDSLDDRVRRSTGIMVKKVDPGVREELKTELSAPARSRRLRGLQIAQAMQVALELEETIVELLADSDHMVRAEAARTLKLCSTACAVQALKRALDDRSVAVQEAARESIDVLAGRDGAASAVVRHREDIR